MADLDPRSRGLHQRVITDLGQQIAGGTLAAGEQVVPEEVGARLGISRSVVREALRDLQAKGMVLPRPKIGTRVLPIESWNLMDTQVIEWRVRTAAREDQLRDLLELRFSVEMTALRTVAAHPTPDVITMLEQHCDAMEDGIRYRDRSAFTEADVAFHATILKASGNLIFRQFIAPIGAVLRALDDLELLPEEVDLGVVDRHRCVVGALTEGDGDQAVAATHQLIANSRREIGLD